MIFHKSCHAHGLDSMVMKRLRDVKTDKNYYFYIYDNVFKMDYGNFYDEKCSSLNTWNYDLSYELHLNKPRVLLDSVRFGFGDYSDDGLSETVVLKTTNVTWDFTKCPHKSQTHKVFRQEYEKSYDKERWFAQRELISDSEQKEELNVFVIRDLDTRKLYTYCFLVKSDKKAMNRKQTRCTFTEIDYPLDEKFIEYCDYIKIDYGRIELIKDKNLGWCIIDVNNSPGGGPSSVQACDKIASMLLKTIV